MAIIMRLYILRNEKIQLKNTTFYCYKAQLQFVGWLKQHLRRTDFRGQPGPQVEKRRASWQSDKSQPRSRCRCIQIRQCLLGRRLLFHLGLSALSSVLCPCAGSGFLCLSLSHFDGTYPSATSGWKYRSCKWRRNSWNTHQPHPELFWQGLD